MTATRIRRPQSLIELDPNIAPNTAAPDRIYASLKHKILTCVLPPGQRLNESEIAEGMGVSRTPLREALNRLSLENLVILTPYRGYAVAPATVEDIKELLELRKIVESESAALAASRRKLEEIQQLEQLAELRYRPGKRETYDKYLQANSAFHLALAKCSRNGRLEAVVISVLDQLQRPLYLGLDIGLDPKAATAEHLELVEAIRKSDSERARTLMAEQISRAEARVLAVAARINSETELTEKTGVHEQK